MRRRSWQRALYAILCFALLCIQSLPTHAAGPTRTYTITNLGTLGGNFSRAAAINNAGQVVGESGTGEIIAESHEPPANAFVWHRGRMTDLGRPKYAGTSKAVDINNVGQVAYVAVNEDQDNAAIWKAGRFTWIGSWHTVLAINDAGAAVGYDNTEEEVWPFMWKNGVKTYLSPPPASGIPSDINNRGQVVGTMDGPVLWQNGRVEQLPLGNARWGSAFAINDNGVIVGGIRTKANTTRATLWQNGQLTDLGTLGGATSEAFGINIHGTIVGTAKNASGKDRAFIRRGGPLIDLNTVLPRNSGWVLQQAVDINDRGQIVGNGTYKGEQRAFLLTPRTTFEAEACSVASPFTVKNGLVSQSTHTLDPARGGTIRCRFTAPVSSTYIVKMAVRSPSGGANSVFVNVDAQPTTPTMIWDIPVYATVTERTVGWRGNGTPDQNQIWPKVFTLKAGTHELIIRGREAGTAIDKIYIQPY